MARLWLGYTGSAIARLYNIEEEDEVIVYIRFIFFFILYISLRFINLRFINLARELNLNPFS